MSVQPQRLTGGRVHGQERSTHECSAESHVIDSCACYAQIEGSSLQLRRGQWRQTLTVHEDAGRLAACISDASLTCYDQRIKVE